MCRFCKLCFVLGVSLLANVWIVAHGAEMTKAGEGDEGVDSDAAMEEIKEKIMEEAQLHDPDEAVEDIPQPSAENPVVESESEGGDDDMDGEDEAGDIEGENPSVEDEADDMDEEGDDEEPKPGSEDEEEDSVWVDEHLSRDQFAKIHKKVDASGDGKISISELLDFSDFTRNKIVQKEALEGFPQMDGDDDGKISLDELLENTVGAVDAIAGKEDADEKAMRELDTAKFKAADKNGDGFLDKDESVGFLYPELNDGVLVLIASNSVKTKDKNNDGELEHAEFWAEADGAEEDDIDPPNQDILDNQKEEFGKLDLNKNGKLDAKELKHWESGRFHTVDALEHLFGIADEDEDGFVTASELDRSRLHLSNHVGMPHLQEWAEHYEL